MNLMLAFVFFFFYKFYFLFTKIKAEVNPLKKIKNKIRFSIMKWLVSVNIKYEIISYILFSLFFLHL